MDRCYNDVTEIGAVFWTKDESDADLKPMSRRSAHVPGVTDTATGAKKRDTMSRQQVLTQSKQRVTSRKGQARTQTSEKPTKEGKGNLSKQDEKSPTKEAPSLKDLRVEDKKRVANLIKELAKIGEEKEVALQQLQVERKENKVKTKELQAQLVAILKERENIQQQYLDCQKLLSSYQTKVSENQEKLSNSLHEGSSHIPHKENISTSGWSPIKESGKMIPVSNPRSSDSQQKFFQLQPIPDPSPAESNQSVTKTTPSSNSAFQPSRDASFHKHEQIDSQFKDKAEQFNPLLSSTHRQHHHQSRFLSKSGGQGTEAVQSGLSNGLSRKPQRMYELSPSVASSKNNRLQPHNGQGSLQQTIQEPGSRNRLSSDTFLPLQEVTDFTKSSDDPDPLAHVRRSSERVPQSDGWASLPEMNGNLPSNVESRLKESMGVDDPQYRNHGPQGIRNEDENNEEWEDHQHLAPQQRPQTIGSMRERLQQEQEWLQHKLLQQEKLLHEKQLEIQMQKLQLSQESQQQLKQQMMDRENNSGYENVRRKYLQQSKTESQRQGGVGGPVHRRGEDPVSQDVHVKIPADGQRGARPVEQNHTVSSREQHPALIGVFDTEDQASTKFPPEGIEQYGQKTDQPYSTVQDQVYWDQRYGLRDEEYFDIKDDDEYYIEDGDAVRAWYKSKRREEMEDAHGPDSIQGYASLHPRVDRRQGATEPPFGGHDPKQQIGNITAILDAETIEAVDSSVSDRDHRMLGAHQVQQSLTAVPDHRSTGVSRTRGVPHGYVSGVYGSMPYTGVTGHVPQEQRAASMLHQEVGDGLHYHRTTNRVPRNIGIPYAGVMGHKSHDQIARTRGADDMLPQGVSGDIPHPRTTGSVPHRRFPHIGSTHGVPHTQLGGNIPQSRIPRHDSTNASFPDQHSHIYPNYHQEDVEAFTSRVGPEERSKPKGQKVSQDRIGQSPHHADRGSLGTFMAHGGYRTQGQGHGRQLTVSDARLMQRSNQVIREIGLLLDQDSEVGEEEESRVLEDVFFLK